MRAILELMAPAELLDVKEEPAHTAVRLNEFLRQASHLLRSGVDLLALELNK